MKNKYDILDDTACIYLNRKDGTILKTFIDFKDFNRANDFLLTWFAKWNIYTESFYCVGNIVEESGKRTIVYLHRWITYAPKNIEVDHINHDTLNNLGSNLRHTESHLNQHNRLKANKNSKTGVRGVTWNVEYESYQAIIMVKGKSNHLGYFKSVDEAHQCLEDFREKYIKYPNCLNKDIPIKP